MPYSSLARLLVGSRAATEVVILDHHWLDARSRTTDNDHDFALGRTAVPGVSTLVSMWGSEQTVGPADAKHTLLTGALLTALDEATEPISLAELLDVGRATVRKPERPRYEEVPPPAG